jgi:hypothetical protein
MIWAALKQIAKSNRFRAGFRHSLPDEKSGELRQSLNPSRKKEYKE